MKQETDIVLYKATDGTICLDVRTDGDTVWLNRNQMAVLFDRDVKTIGKHINNALNEELQGFPVVAKFATTASDGKSYNVEHYNLDAVLSVGYRVKSARGVDFRKWASNILKEYVIKGYAANKNRLEQLGNAIQIIRRTEDRLDAIQILDVVESYTFALDMLDDYDHQKITKPSGSKAIYVLTYDECRRFIDKMKFSRAATLFGNEKDDSFKSSIGTIYQTIMGEDVYPSVEEKAANLLYLITKNHSFSDGNKRIAAALFLYFLDKNNKLYREDGEKTINDHTLVAVTILIAESNSKEKEAMISMIMNFLVK
ncbi:MAG: virulence RhuM family protein [Methanomethylovorans sp.]|jgi:prophage maintenance system killer protein|nr:virulence RhuM family protein [Methanomethylovorans sp.]